MTRYVIPVLTFFASTGTAFAQPESGTTGRDSRLFELRTYHVANRHVDALNSRFRDHYTQLFEEHGITNVGYWTPADDEDPRVVFLLAYPSAAARERSWAALVVDPRYRKVRRDSEKDGRLVDRIDEMMLTATEASPFLTATRASQPRAFELRTYAIPAGDGDRMAKLHEKHKDALVGSWTTIGGTVGEVTLVHLLAHTRTESVVLTADGPHSDRHHISTAKPVVNVRSRTAAGDGAKSLMLNPTDYSPLR